MARYRGQKALYEVIGKNRRRRDGGVEPLHPEPESDAGGVESDDLAGIPVEARWRRPRAVQFNAGKVEVTLSYLVVAACALVFMLGLLGAYRLGQWAAVGSRESMSAPRAHESAVAGPGSLENLKNGITNGALFDTGNSSQRTGEAEDNPGTKMHGNAIGILTYRDRTQLVPVKEYYRANGIETEILRVDSGFILVTTERFRDNPARTGSDGYDRLQEIVELGAEYQPPSGYLSFTRESFEGAHGVLIQ